MMYTVLDSDPSRRFIMKDLLFAFNSVAPIIFTVAVGYFLKRIGMIDATFAKAANRLVFRVFLPVMLFMNVYGIDSLSGGSYGYAIYATLAVVLIFLVGIPVVMLLTKDPSRRAALLQGIFRSNYALIGIPLAERIAGAEGAAVATVLSAVTIPVFNILAVIALSIFTEGKKGSLKKVLLGIVKNPLIISIAAGLVALGVRAVFVRCGVSFRLSEVTSVWATMKYLSNIATPMALIVLGAQFEFSAVSSLKKEIISGTLLRCIIVPILGLGVAYFAFGKSFSGAEYAALVAVFSTPVAVSSVPMAQEMGADSTLAGQLVVFTTLSSAFTVFLASFVLRLLGVF